MHEVWIVPGASSEWHTQDNIHHFTFTSKYAMNAFLEGVHFAEGWMEVREFDSEAEALEYTKQS